MEKNMWHEDIASLGKGATFRLYNETYEITGFGSSTKSGINVLLKRRSDNKQIEKTSPLSVYNGGLNFEVLSIPAGGPEPAHKARKPLELGPGFVLLGGKDDPYKDAPLSKVAARKKR